MHKCGIVMCERVESSRLIRNAHLHRQLDLFYGIHREQAQLPVEDIQGHDILEPGSFK